MARLTPDPDGKALTLQTFPAHVVGDLAGPGWLRQRRQEALVALDVLPLPSEKEEVWRYSPIDELNLDAYEPAAGGGVLGPLGAAFVKGLAADIPERSALVVLRNGALVTLEAPGLPEGLTVGSLATGPVGVDSLGDVLNGGDALVRLNDAFHPDVVVVDVPSGVRLGAPVVVIQWCDGATGSGPVTAPASFPRSLVRLGREARASIVEVVAGAPDGARALVVPVTELWADDGSDLSYVSLQVLGTGAWHIGRLAASVGRDATLRTFAVGLGGAYDRSRTDATVTGQGGSSQLKSAYLGTGTQVHDIRTMQDHAAPRTTSDLLCKGAVAGASRSVYSGLIRVRHGAVKTSAMQTNNNLVLDERAHADSVPNLDIEENDVRCSHASTVGPVDEDQRYYLESRGVPPQQAERLIVLGFFEDIMRQAPEPAVVARLRREVGIRLAEALGITSSDPPVPEPLPEVGTEMRPGQPDTEEASHG